jgi:hypothetical protein
MRARDSVLRTLGLVLPACLVMVSVVLLAAAVGAMLLRADGDLQWELFGEGAACWIVGVAWGCHLTLSPRRPLARTDVDRP